MSSLNGMNAALPRAMRVFITIDRGMTHGSVNLLLLMAFSSLFTHSGFARTWPIDDSNSDQNRMGTSVFGDYRESASGDTVTLHEGIDIPSLSQVNPNDTRVRCVKSNKVWKFVGTRLIDGRRKGCSGPGHPA